MSWRVVGYAADGSVVCEDTETGEVWSCQDAPRTVSAPAGATRSTGAPEAPGRARETDEAP